MNNLNQKGGKSPEELAAEALKAGATVTVVAPAESNASVPADQDEKVSLPYDTESYMSPVEELAKGDIYEVLPNGDHLTFSLDEEKKQIYYFLEQSKKKVAEEQPVVSREISEADIKVLAIRLARPGIKAVGYADISIMDFLTLKNLKLVESVQTPGTYFVSPSQSFSGTKKDYFANYWFTNEKIRNLINAIVEKAIIAARTAAENKTATPAANLADGPQEAKKTIENGFDLDLVARQAEKALYSKATQFRGQTIKVIDKGQGNLLRYVVIDDVTFIQQNPQTGSTYAVLAKDGHLVTWAIRSVTKDGKPDQVWLGHVLDGKFVPKTNKQG